MTESNTPSVSSTPRSRPLSPHLSIYRWHISMALSILHRATGVALVAGTILFVFWLWCMAYCPESVAYFVQFGQAWWGKVLLIGWTFAFYLHFANGLRHLIWDTGSGLELGAAKRSGQIVAFGAVFLTAATWYALLVL